MPANLFSTWKLALFGGLLVFSALFWLNSHVGYQAKSALLLKGSGNTADDVLAETIAAFGETETFRERTLRSTSLQDSVVGQMESTEQFDLVKNVKTKGGKKGGLITIVSMQKDAEVAEIVSNESTETLVRMTRLYIGGQEEVSLIVIDQAIVSKSVVEPVSYALKSLASAIVLFIVLTLLQPLFRFIKKKIGKTPFSFGKSRIENEKESGIASAVEPEERDVRFVPQKLDPTFLYPEREATPDTQSAFEQPKASEILKGEVYGEAPKNALQSVSVSMDDLPFTFETPVSETGEEQIFEQKESQDIDPEREPTVVEYKQRLNELLTQK